MSTAAPVSVTWESSLVFFNRERMADILLGVNGECSDRCGDEGEGGFGFGKLPARTNGGIECIWHHTLLSHITQCWMESLK
jgi:hypothetical protein